MPDLKTAMRAAERPEAKSENIQDVFLNNARRDRVLVTIQLMNGSKLIGKVRSFDKWSLILDSNHQDQLIYKHAIAIIGTQTRAGNANGGVQSPGGNAASNSPSEG